MPRERGRPRGRDRVPREASAELHRALTDPVAVCARVAADWHASWLTALGLRSERSGSVWHALDEPPFIYWSAITLARDASTQQLADARGTVCDSWSVLELEPFGFEIRAREPWFVRRVGRLAVSSPPELETVDVAAPAEVREFEEVSARGFSGEGATVETPFHPPSILADSRMRMLIGRVSGEPVAAAMSYRSGDAVGIFGVTTIERARGRGYASALTAALVDPALQTVLSPSPEAENLYRRLGFEQVGELRQWTSRRKQS